MNTPTKPATPAPTVLREMADAVQRERRAYRNQRTWSLLQKGSVVLSYLTFAALIGHLLAH